MVRLFCDTNFFWGGLGWGARVGAGEVGAHEKVLGLIFELKKEICRNHLMPFMPIGKICMTTPKNNILPKRPTFVSASHISLIPLSQCPSQVNDFEANNVRREQVVSSSLNIDSIESTGEISPFNSSWKEVFPVSVKYLIQPRKPSLLLQIGTLAQTMDILKWLGPS